MHLFNERERAGGRRGGGGGGGRMGGGEGFHIFANLSSGKMLYMLVNFVY